MSAAADPSVFPAQSRISVTREPALLAARRERRLFGDLASRAVLVGSERPGCELIWGGSAALVVFGLRRVAHLVAAGLVDLAHASCHVVGEADHGPRVGGDDSQGPPGMHAFDVVDGPSGVVVVVEVARPLRMSARMLTGYRRQ